MSKKMFRVIFVIVMVLVGAVLYKACNDIMTSSMAQQPNAMELVDSY